MVIMQNLAIEGMQNALIKSILNIKNEDILKEIQASIALAEEKETSIDDTCMSKQEFFNMLDERMKEFEKGNYISFSSPEEMHKYFESL